MQAMPAQSLDDGGDDYLEIVGVETIDEQLERRIEHEAEIGTLVDLSQQDEEQEDEVRHGDTASNKTKHRPRSLVKTEKHTNYKSVGNTTCTNGDDNGDEEWSGLEYDCGDSGDEEIEDTDEEIDDGRRKRKQPSKEKNRLRKLKKRNGTSPETPASTSACSSGSNSIAALASSSSSSSLSSSSSSSSTSNTLCSTCAGRLKGLCIACNPKKPAKGRLTKKAPSPNEVKKPVQFKETCDVCHGRMRGLCVACRL